MFEKVGKWESWKESKDIFPPPPNLYSTYLGEKISFWKGVGGGKNTIFLGKYIPLNYNVPFDLNLLVKE